KATRLGARAGGPADVLLDDGTPAFVDGGPRQPLDVGVSVIHRESVEAGTLRRARHCPPAARLAPDQLAAVTHGAGPARVIAPAGSGKTRVLTERLRHLVGDQGWESSTVTAVAFNKRAADELIERTQGLDVHVRTINALGLAVLTGALGGPPPDRRPTVIEEFEVRRILDALVEVRRQANTDVLAPYLEALGAIRIGLRDPAEVEASIPDAAGLTDLWPRYRAALDRAGAIDFDDQVERAIGRLLSDPDVRVAAQRRCRHLLVDEFQDLAPAHLLLLRLLASPGLDVFGVGDDDQVIYGYAGATPTYLIDFERWFPGAVPHALEVNYRCPEAVVDGARHLLGYNRRRIPKTIRTPEQAPAGALDVQSVAPDAMAEAAASTVVATARPPEEIAVLTRVNSALLPVQIVLGRAGVPTTLPLDRRVLERTGIRTALAWLRLGTDPGRIARADVGETIRRPSRRVSRNVVEMLTKRAWTSVADVHRLAGRLSGGDVEKLLGYAGDIEAVSAAVPNGTAAALSAIRTRVGLGTAMDTLDASRAEADRSTHGDDLRALEQVAALHPDAATFAAWLDDQLTHPGRAVGPAVTLSTVHRVKGQEWPLVIVFGAHADAFPHRLATDVEEERRIFHVAITRASDRAVVLVDQTHPSPFAAELSGARPDVPLRGRSDPRPSGGTATGRAGGRGGRSAGAGSSAEGEGPPVEPGLWEALRVWRREVATRTGVPAYVVLSDADLRGVAQRRPATIEELRGCRGFGPTKLERYGDELLAVLEAATAQPSPPPTR
ncbi:MAG TPA: ATP-dependent DNA helicase UvrD2, partial [Acidimicrobiales bacterium]